MLFFFIRPKRGGGVFKVRFSRRLGRIERVFFTVFFTLLKSKRKNGKRKMNKANERNNAKRLYKYTDREHINLVLVENIFSLCLATTVVFVGFTTSNGRIFA